MSLENSLIRVRRPGTVLDNRKKDGLETADFEGGTNTEMRTQAASRLLEPGSRS